MPEFMFYKDRTKRPIQLGAFIDSGSGDFVVGFESNDSIAGFLSIDADDGKIHLSKIRLNHPGLSLDKEGYLQIVRD